MCTAYEIGTNASRQEAPQLADLIAALAKLPPRLIRRTDPAPVVTGDLELKDMRWGFRRPWSNAINNARADKLATPMWLDAFQHRRCLIPASAFYEWSGPDRHKRTHRFTRPGGGLLWIAGLWELDPEPVFSMITTEPNALMEPIHDRMPAVLADHEIAPFLAGEMSRFNPLPESLQVTDAANPLKKPRPPSAQGELF